MIEHDLGVKLEYKYELKKNLTAIILKRILSKILASGQNANFSLNFKKPQKARRFQSLALQASLARYAINSAVAAKQHATQVAT